MRSPAPAEPALRLFAALPAPPALQLLAGRAASHFESLPGLRPIPAHLLHLTLRFLGDTSASAVEEIGSTLRNIANSCSSFVLHSGSLLYLPRAARPRVLAFAVDEPPEKPLRKLVEKLEQELHRSEEPSGRESYLPHVTVARIRAGRRDRPPSRLECAELLAGWQARSESPAGWQAMEIHLVKSRLTPAGPEYSVLERLPLGTAGTTPAVDGMSGGQSGEIKNG